MMKRYCARSAGFTLIEVLLVIGILLVLGTVSVVGYTRIKAGADKKATRLMVNQTVDAVSLFFTAVNRFPDSAEGLEALITLPEDENDAEKWTSGGGPFLKNGRIPLDPWGSELRYELAEEAMGTYAGTTGPGFRLWSLGPDGQDGTEDDIRNWSEDSGL